MKITPIKTRIFRENEDLFLYVLQHVKKLSEKSVLVVTSKIVSLSEGRTVPYESLKEKNALIKKESEFFLSTKNTLFTIKDGMVMAFAGVDESNGDGKLILLPKSSSKSAHVLRKKLMRHFKLKNLGVLITDSEFMPLRVGAIGGAIGYAGFRGTRNYIGKKDIFGRVMKMSKTNVADSLAAGAVVCMGEGRERQPLAVIANAPVVFTDKKVKPNELLMPEREDMYAPFFANLKGFKRKKHGKK